MYDLRTALRARTAKSHEILDSELVRYNLTEPLGLSKYLSVHYIALTALTKGLSANAQRHSISKKIDDIQVDFEVLGKCLPSCKILVKEKATHPLGLTYVMAGSSLGSKVLYKQWASSSNPTVKAAGRFITNSKNSSEWKIFLERLKSLTLDPSEIENVIDTANRVFEMYIVASERVKRDL